MGLVIETTAGTVRGVERDGVRVWRGIPYAEPPLGPLRFRPPRPPIRWGGERDASHAGAFAIQSRDSVMGGVTEKTVLSEDCLFVNVFAPADREPAPANRPVVVWIHGGAFIMGSGAVPLYHGASFASRHDLVVVTINYRLGLLGLLYLGDLGGDEAGNIALLDQVAALAWVRDNIAAFGGDPGNVTVMGESAGAVSIANLLAMPAARGLFHRAILQSGASGFSPPTRADATANAKRVLAELGTTAAGLADVPVAKLLEVQTTLGRERGLGAFAPYVDGVTMPREPLAIVRAGEGAKVPVLLGSNRDEWALFDTFLPDTTVALKAQLTGHFGPALERMREAYRSWNDLIGDVAFRIPMIRLAEAHPAPVHMYRFDVTSPAFGGRLGAAHALELPFVWNRLDQQLAQLLLGNDLTPFRALALQIHDTWAAFITSGSPQGGGLPAWPRYDATTRATLIIDHESRVVEDPDGTQRMLWSAA
jgi:para-nitrobenzyl esterase